MHSNSERLFYFFKLSCLLLAGILLSPLATPRAAAQSTYYIGPTGNDADSGSQNYPWATITHASSITRPGDTVIVEDGTYHLPAGGWVNGTPAGDWSISSNGTSGHPITYIAQHKWQAKLIGQGTGDGSTVVGMYGGYNILENFDITGTDAAGVILATTGTAASYNQAIGNYVHDIVTPCDGNGGAGLNTGGGSSYSGISHDDFIGNLVVNIRVPNGCASSSVNAGIYEAVPYGVVANNIVMNVAGAAIQSWHDAYHLMIFGNDAMNSTDGIVVGDGDAPGGVTNDYTVVQNNITVNNSYCGICEGGRTGTHNTYTDNLSYGNYANILLQNGLAAKGTVTADPKFVNNTGTAAGDYGLQLTSPARGTGLAWAGATTDYSGNPRPQSGATDIGACLFSGSSTPSTAGTVGAGISASPTTVAPGRATTLTWNTVNAVSADLNGTTVPLRGSQVVYPAVTTAYRVTAYSSAGATDEGTVTVTVVGAGIKASPTSVPLGGSTTLTWTTTGAVSADLNGTSVPLNGSLVVYPTATTSYRVTAHSATGATDEGTVNVPVY